MRAARTREKRAFEGSAGKRMKKILLFILIIGLAAAACGAVAVHAEEEGGAGSANQTEYELFMPGEYSPENSSQSFTAYEQYLELENPSDLAICEKYVAIADQSVSGNNSSIYILQRDGGEPRYVRYSHTNANAISGLNFYNAEDGSTYLFFFSAIGTISWLDCGDPSQTGNVDTEIRPYSMIVSGSYIYYTQANDTYSDVYVSTIEETDGGFTIPTPSEALQSNLAGNSSTFSEYGGTVYLANRKQIYTCTPTEFLPQYSLSLNDVDNFAITANNERQIVYIGAGNMYINDETTVIGEFSVVKLFDGMIYAIENDRVRQYDLTADSFTEYMIGKYSEYTNRLDAAQDISSYADKVVIADTGNSRITVYDGTFTVYASQYPADLVCAGETHFLAVAGSVAYLYGYEGGTYTESFSLDGAISGAAYSFGKFYLVSANGRDTYEIDCADLSVQHGTPNITSPENLAADIYGNLYVLTANGQVNRYSRDEFLSSTAASSERIAQFSADAHDIFVDYSGLVYVLTENSVCCGDADLSPVTVTLDLGEAVFNGTEKTALAFTFEQENGAIHLLSDGFVVKLGLGANAPRSLKNISADGLYEAINGDTEESAARGMLVTVPADSVLLSLDAENLAENAQTVSYSDYSPLGEARVGILVCELPDGGGSVVAFFEYDPEYTFEAGGNQFTATLRDYTLALVLGDESELTVLSEAYDDTGYVGYTTNEVGLYRFPAMSLLTERNNPDNPLETEEKVSVSERLAKNEAVTVLFTLRCAADDSQRFGLDADYCFVRTERGTYGFVPANYVLSYDPSSTVSANFEFRNLRKGASVTLYASDGQPLTLSSREQLKVYGEADENGMIYAEYTDESGVVYSGYIEESSLYSASGSVVAVLVAVTLVTAAVLCSVCYLIFRKQPTLQ